MMTLRSSFLGSKGLTGSGKGIRLTVSQDAWARLGRAGQLSPWAVVSITSGL